MFRNQPRSFAGSKRWVLVATAAAALLVPSAAQADEARIETSVNAGRGFYKAERRIELRFRIAHATPVSARVALVRTSDRRVMRTWNFEGVKSGDVNRVVWNGVVDGRVAPNARYRFKVRAERTEPTTVMTGETQASRQRSRRFDFYRHKFPVQGPHDYGSSGSRFGAPRSGHRHQGQDVAAACGTRLVAARGGKVQTRQYQSGGAGYYLVIDGAKTNVDYVYMHLQGPGEVRAGERVHTGEKIGRVGNTGASSGCHLHFEMWSGPGWYQGGDPFDPLPALQKWDGWS